MKGVLAECGISSSTRDGDDGSCFVLTSTEVLQSAGPIKCAEAEGRIKVLFQEDAAQGAAPAASPSSGSGNKDGDWVLHSKTGRRGRALRQPHSSWVTFKFEQGEERIRASELERVREGGVLGPFGVAAAVMAEQSAAKAGEETAWSKEEDNLLLSLVATHGKKFGLIASKLDGRSLKQCKERCVALSVLLFTQLISLFSTSLPSRFLSRSSPPSPHHRCCWRPTGSNT